MIDQVYNTDCVQWMESYTGDPFADLIIADPPFNIKWQYDIYIDQMPDDLFVAWNKRWLAAAINKCLKPHGQILICMGDEYVDDIAVLCKREFLLTRQNWMIWHYAFGQSGKLHTRRRFTRSKTHILRYTKHPEHFTFNPGEVAVPSARQLKYNDKRADLRGKCPDDVFIYKRIAGTHKDRVEKMTCQMPIGLVSTWIKAMTDKGDTVFDPMAGSGVTLAAAKELGRHYVGCELSPTYHALIEARLSTIP